MVDKMEKVLAFQRAALRVHNQRQQMIASNIANADTPHYKAKDDGVGISPTPTRPIIKRKISIFALRWGRCEKNGEFRLRN